MAKVSVGIGPGEFHSPFGERVSFPVGQEVERPIEDVYWLSRVQGVSLKYDSPEEEARAKELEDAENERILRPLKASNQNHNATITVPSEGLYDYPIVVVNPRGLMDMYNPNTATPQVQIKLDEDEIRRIVQAVLQAEGTAHTPAKEKESPPHTQVLTPPPADVPAVYDAPVDAPESKRDTARVTEVRDVPEAQALNPSYMPDSLLDALTQPDQDEDKRLDEPKERKPGDEPKDGKATAKKAKRDL